MTDLYSVYENLECNNTKNSGSILTQRIKQEKNNSLKGKESLSDTTMEYCSQFETCSAPKCPLDILIDSRAQTEYDPKCKMSKITRHKCWLSMPEYLKKELEYQGYFESEYNRMKSARERWLALPEQKKAEIRERMRNVKHG